MAFDRTSKSPSKAIFLPLLLIVEDNFLKKLPLEFMYFFPFSRRLTGLLSDANYHPCRLQLKALLYMMESLLLALVALKLAITALVVGSALASV